MTKTINLFLGKFKHNEAFCHVMSVATHYSQDEVMKGETVPYVEQTWESWGKEHVFADCYDASLLYTL